MYNMTDNNSNTSSDNSEPETELPDFNILKPFDMGPKKKSQSQKLCQSWIQDCCNIQDGAFCNNSQLLSQSAPSWMLQQSQIRLCSNSEISKISFILEYSPPAQSIEEPIKTSESIPGKIFQSNLSKFVYSILRRDAHSSSSIG